MRVAGDVGNDSRHLPAEGAAPFADDDRRSSPPRCFEPIPDVDGLVRESLPQASKAARAVPILWAEEQLVGHLPATI